jgi:hypothetical protein
LAEQRTKNDRKWPKKQVKVYVQLSLGLKVHTPREVMTFRPNFAIHGERNNCHRGLDHFSQVTISPSPPEGGQKICGLNITETKKKMWVEKFKSPTVTRTKRMGRTVTRTKHGWTKPQGTIVTHIGSVFSCCLQQGGWPRA